MLGRPPIIIATIHRRRSHTGPSTHTREFVRFLEREGTPVRVVTPFTQRRSVAIPVLGARRLIDRVSERAGVWWFRTLRAAFLQRSLSSVLRDHPQAVIYARCPVSARAALRARRHSEQKVVLAVHMNGSEADELADAGTIVASGPFYRRVCELEARVFAAVDGLHFVSRFVRDQVHARHPAAVDRRSALIPNFIADPGPCADGPIAGDLLSVGTLEPRKNQGYLLDVLRAARDRGYRYRLTLVGDGPDRRRLQRQAQDRRLGDQVRFLGARRDIARLLAHHRVYAHSAVLENCPFALIEAFAGARPVLAGAVGGIPELLEDGGPGSHWPLEDPEQGARKLIELLEDAELYRRLSRAARERFETSYHADIHAPGLRDFLFAALDRDGS